MRRLGLGLSLSLVLGALGFAPNALAGPACTFEEVPVESFHAKVGKLKDRYPIPTRIDFHVTVTRPAHKNPATGQPQQPPASQPVDGADVYVAIMAGDEDRQTYHWGTGRTGQEGKTLIPVDIPEFAEPGTADVRIYARKQTVNDPARCVNTYEYGYKNIPNAFVLYRP